MTALESLKQANRDLALTLARRDRAMETMKAEAAKLRSAQAAADAAKTALAAALDEFKDAVEAHSELVTAQSNLIYDLAFELEFDTSAEVEDQKDELDAILAFDPNAA